MRSFRLFTSLFSQSRCADSTPLFRKERSSQQPDMLRDTSLSAPLPAHAPKRKCTRAAPLRLVSLASRTFPRNVRSSRLTARIPAGFTLIEVMVAIAILALSLTALFSTEVGVVKTAQRARAMSVATLLARCKMAEVEEHILNEGLPAIEKIETDECCEDAEWDGYECEWRIERVTLPEAEVEGDGLEGNDLEESGGQNGPDPLAMASAIPTSVEDMATNSPGGGDMASMAIGYAFPILKPSIEEQVRRITVKVQWEEGDRKRSFDVVQFVANEQGVPPEIPDDGTGGTGDSP